MRRSLWNARTKSVTASVALVSVAAAAVVLASKADGLPPTHADLNDGGVWVTNSSDANGLVARFFVPIDQQDAPGSGLGAGFDVVQLGSDVVLVGTQGDLQPWDTVNNAPVGNPRHFGAASSVSIGGEESSDFAQSRSVTAILDQSSGALRVVSTRNLATFDPAKSKPIVSLGEKASVVVAPDGSVVGLSAKDRAVIVFAPGSTSEPTTTPLPSQLSGSELALTTVGTGAVVLDPSTQNLLLPDGHVEPVSGFGNRLVLQQPGPDSRTVLLGSPQGVVEVPLDHGPAHLLGDPLAGVDSERAVVAPIRLPSGCARGAVVTASSVQLLDAECPGRPEPRARELQNAQGQRFAPGASGFLVFRVNHGLSVLNDTATGAVWNPDDVVLRQREDWNQVKQEDKTTPKVDQNRTVRQDCPAPGATNQKPVVARDEVGARAGVPVVVDVLRNDRDPDCDVLAIDEASLVIAPEGGGSAALVGDGRHLQVTTKPGVGSVTVTYNVTDGRGEQASSTLTVHVIGTSTNRAPQPIDGSKNPTTTAIRGKSVSYNVLGDWMDPDGDPLQLLTASVAGGEGDVVYQPDGLLTYTDGGARVGKVTVTVGVSDGVHTSNGKLVVDVQPPGTDLKPIARDDYARGVVGQPIELRLLANDADPNGNPLHLGRVKVVQAAGAAASALVVDSSSEDRTVVSLDAKLLRGSSASFALEYELVAGRGSAVGRARVDIVAAGRNRSPAPQVDVAAVRVGTSTEVDVLRNDVDPDGDVLAVTSVDTHGNDQTVLASVQGSALVRVQLLQTITTPVQITYSVTDGRSSPVPCVIVVTQAPTQVVVQQPVARPDIATVRAGAMVAIPVLRNDSANSGGDLVLSRRLAEQPSAGKAFIDGDVVRYLAPTEAGVDSLSYSVTDSGDATRPSVGRVSIQILPADAKNRAPQPITVSARAVRPATADVAPPTTTIPVPLTGVDPDGDQVIIDNPDVSDEFHNRVELSATGDAILYTPVALRTGTDHVRYRVCDVRPERACSEGLLQVAVFTRLSNDPPTTTPDTAVVLPGHTVSVDVLSNDVDPDGDKVSFAKPGLGLLPQGFTAELGDGGRIAVTAPKAEGTATITYYVTDGRSSTRVPGTLTITVDPTAPLLPPIARDDVVSPQAVADAVSSGSTTVKVDVLANDSDPDGPSSQLHVQAVAGSDGATPSADKKFMLVTPGTAWRTVAYEAVDADGKTAIAFIAVPPSGNAGPVQATAVPREVKPGEKITLPISDFARDPDSGPEPLTFVLTAPPRTSGGEVTFDPSSDKALVLTAPQMPKQGQPPEFLDVSALVTDGKAQLLAHVRVALLLGNRPPTFSTPTVLVEAVLDAPPTSVPLVVAAHVTDPDAADAGSVPSFTTAQGTTDGVDWTLNGSGQLDLTPGQAAKPGTSFSIPVHLEDRQGAGTDGVVLVRVVTTTAGPLVAAALTEPHVDQGGSISVDVVGKNTDPFQGTRRPLSVMAAGLHVDGAATATVEGGSIRISAADNAAPGWVVVTYRIMDAAQRTSDGTIRVPLWGKPDAPKNPVVVATTGRTVTLSWTPGKTNITSANPDDNAVTYKVSAPGVVPVTSSVPQATINGLTAGVEYTFTIVAHNAVDDSTSGAVINATPDAVPKAPVVQVLTDPATFDAQYLTIVVTQPVPDEGPDGASAISHYTINYGSAKAGSLATLPGLAYGATAQQFKLTGLTKGEPYNISLCPENKATIATGTVVCSDPPAAGVPIGLPANVTGQVANGLNAVNTNIVVTATWSPVTGTDGMGGDTAVSYRCALLNAGGSVVGATLTTKNTSCALAAVAGTSYRVRISTINAKGESAGSLTAPVTARGTPGPVLGLVVSATGNDRELLVRFQPPSDDGCNGACLSRLTYTYSVNGSWAPLSGSGATILVPSNGVQYSIAVRADNSVDGPGTGQPGPYNPVTAPAAYGPPGVPTLSFARGRETNVEAAWSTPAGYNPYGVRTDITISGVLGWTPVSASGSGSWGTGGIGGTYTVSLRSCETGGQGRCSGIVSLQAQTMVLSAGKGALHQSRPACTDPSCAWVTVGIANGLPNHTYTFMDCGTFGGASCGSYRFGVTTDSNGNAYAASGTFVFGYPGYEAYTCVAGTSWCTNRVGW